jgi:predicted TPR repeat methyltransferase
LLPAPAADLHILDAGCGTGLCGPLLRPFAETLAGVDLSGKMLEKASARAVYDELHAAELTAYINESVSAYDVIASADTLCYFGKLEPVFAAAARALKPGGHFIFTVEKTASDKEAAKVTLEHTGRYTHTELYARAALEEAGFEVPRLDTVILRTELFKPVEGMLVVGTKRAS